MVVPGVVAAYHTSTHLVDAALYSVPSTRYTQAWLTLETQSYD
jgi:hypothetical protein